MKVRRDFVTNSSSSSFIISKDDISYDKLLEVLLEIANNERSYWDDEDVYERYDEIAYRYEIHEGTKENPYEDYSGWGYSVYHYDNHFIVDNNSCIRYDWDAVEDVLDKYNIPWHMGYCDQEITYMKIRSDFVTNSSSSSFIIGKKDDTTATIESVYQIIRGLYKEFLDIRDSVLEYVASHPDSGIQYVEENGCGHFTTVSINDYNKRREIMDTFERNFNSFLLSSKFPFPHR